MIAVRAKKQDEVKEGLSSAVSMAKSAVDVAADMLPESVPRPVARGGVAVVGSLILLTIVQKVLSGVFTLAVLAALGYFWFTSKNSKDEDEDDDFKPKKRSSTSDDDPLSEMNQIMDKYK